MQSARCNIYTICPPGYHHNGFVATYALLHTFLMQ